MAVLVTSSLAYLISENINAWVLHKIKILTKSRYLFIRVITSTVTASAVDSVIFCTIAFYNVLSFDVIRTMILSQFLIKVVYAVLGVGLFTVPAGYSENTFMPYPYQQGTERYAYYRKR